VYPVDDDSEADNARVSVTVHSYDDFGQTTNSKQYFGTVSLGVATYCDRTTRLDPSSLKLVLDDYMQYDTPAGVDDEQYVAVGAGSGHYGLMTGHETLSYAEPQEENLFGSLGTGTDPLLVRLTCSTLSDDGTAISAATAGLLPTSAAAPSTTGIIPACTTLGWDETVAPPKVTSFTYDTHGRVLTRTTTWDSSTTAPGGVSSTSDTLSYTLTATTDGEESCTGADVLQTVLTDGQGNATTTRVCTLNDFPLSRSDANGNTTTFQHDADGLTTRVTHPNGAYITYDYYYPCPTAQDGETATCTSTSTAQTNCPYDTQSPARSCVVQTANAGAGNTSYADGVLQASIRDGLGRVVLTRDNLGGVSGSGYTGTQSRTSSTYDSLGLETSRTVQIGASNPLIYTTTTTYDAELRPSQECGPRGMSTQYVRDDIAQQTLLLSNGTQRSQIAYNDSQMPTGIVDCPLVTGSTQGGSGSCPTVAASTSSATCTGSGFYSYSLHDGSGLEHAALASGSGSETGASIKSVTGTSTYSADSLVYSYSMSATPTDSTQSNLTASSAFTRDLQGPAIAMAISVTDRTGTATTFTGDTYSYTNIDQLQSATNNLSTSDASLVESYAYTPVRLLSQHTNYDGRVHRYYYDDMDRMVRYCYPSLTSGSEGETYTYDALAGTITSVTHFTNPGDCSDSSDGDVPGDSITYTYTRFGAVASKTYSTGASLQWGYDMYQRPVCFADAQATAAGSSCASSPIADGYAPSADQLLTYVTYWSDSDPYRRGLVESTCRGVADVPAGTYATKCIDSDYYTSVDTGGSCASDLNSIVGAYAGALKTKQLCTGGSCLAGTGTAVYTTTYTYDEFSRQCEVENVTAAGEIILDSIFTYDQFNNLVQEISTSALDSSTDSNFQTAYTYDGLMRVAGMTRSTLSGSVLETISYTYDAASNITQKVQSVYVTETPTTTTPTPTTSGIGGTRDTPTPGSGATENPTSAPTTPRGMGHDSGCALGDDPPAPLLSPPSAGALVILGIAVLHRSWRRRVAREARHFGNRSPSDQSPTPGS
jgi:YD repeat-containing protein